MVSTVNSKNVVLNKKEELQVHVPVRKPALTYLFDQGNQDASTNIPNSGPATPLTKLCDTCAVQTISVNIQY